MKSIEGLPEPPIRCDMYEYRKPNYGDWVFLIDSGKWHKIDVDVYCSAPFIVASDRNE